VDNIDLQAAQKHDVSVVNAPQATTLAVAELTMAMLLNAARAVPSADSSMKQGKWLKKQFVGSELHGKILGIIGLGNIGRAVAQRGRAFGMQIVGYDIISPPPSVGISEVPLQDLFAQADFITIHTPLTDQTRSLIDAEAIAAMKPGVSLVCAARGGIIDEGALLDGLTSGKVASVGLDVFTTEPPGLTDLVAHPNVTATPHIGAQTQEARERLGVDIAEEILAALRGEELRWRIV
jgi:D-3-phosphoglycerate dehydrogenase